jgi:hypothetical protein
MTETEAESKKLIEASSDDTSSSGPDGKSRQENSGQHKPGRGLIDGFPLEEIERHQESEHANSVYTDEWILAAHKRVLSRVNSLGMISRLEKQLFDRKAELHENI